MHILIISHGYPTDKDPQWGCFEKDQAEALIRLGHQVTIVAIDSRFRTYKRKVGIKYTKDGNIHAFVYFLMPSKLIPHYKLEIALEERMMLKLYNRVVQQIGKPDVIYAHYMASMAQLRLVRKRYNIPVVGIEHWSRLNKQKLTPYERELGEIGYANVDKLLAVSPALQIQIKKHFNKDSDLLYDMVNDLFLKSPIRFKKSVSPFRFIAVGSLIYRKGYDILLKAFSKMKNSNVELLIVGEGRDCEKLKRMSSELGLSNHVRFYGLLSKSEIIKLMNQCDAFCLPSRSETFGVAHIEALAMGLPVVTTKCGGPEYFIKPDNGMLVAIDDVDSLTDSMDMMVENIDMYDPNHIRAYVKSMFSGDVIAKRAEKYILEVLNK